MHTITKSYFSTSYTIIYYTQKQAVTDTNISNVITPYSTPEFCALKYNDLPLWTFLCHLTAKTKHTQLYSIVIQQACTVHNTTIRGITLRHKSKITYYTIITIMCLYNTLTNCVWVVCLRVKAGDHKSYIQWQVVGLGKIKLYIFGPISVNSTQILISIYVYNIS